MSRHTSTRAIETRTSLQPLPKHYLSERSTRKARTLLPDVRLSRPDDGHDDRSLPPDPSSNRRPRPSRSLAFDLGHKPLDYTGCFSFARTPIQVQHVRTPPQPSAQQLFPIVRGIPSAVLHLATTQTSPPWHPLLFSAHLPPDHPRSFQMARLHRPIHRLHLFRRDRHRRYHPPARLFDL